MRLSLVLSQLVLILSGSTVARAETILLENVGRNDVLRSSGFVREGAAVAVEYEYYDQIMAINRGFPQMVKHRVVEIDELRYDPEKRSIVFENREFTTICAEEKDFTPPGVECLAPMIPSAVLDSVLSAFTVTGFVESGNCVVRVGQRFGQRAVVLEIFKP
jgi:hypothetical protein